MTLSDVSSRLGTGEVTPEGQLPAIDAIIPTLNCASLLERCLGRVSKQEYTSQIRICVVDGGSTDGTVEVARRFDANIILARGLYGTGRNGARHLGELNTHAPFVWLLDSDNFLIENTVAANLATPLAKDAKLNLAMPMTAIDPRSSSFNRWLSRIEFHRLAAAVGSAPSADELRRTLDLSYGITNATLIRRSALVAANGYDSDVRLLSRLRHLGLATGVVVGAAHFYHQQATDPLHYLEKTGNRLARFGRMTDAQLYEFFVEPPTGVTKAHRPRVAARNAMLDAPAKSLKEFLRTGEPEWLWGLIFPGLIAAAIARHPISAYRVYSHVL
jgi:glycosyltransferase involved in cell wall biosynthesis